jgi:hypothetical protein
MDWMESDNFTEIIVYSDGDKTNFPNTLTFPVNQKGANDLQEIIRVLIQARMCIEDRLAPTENTVYNNDTEIKE